MLLIWRHWDDATQRAILFLPQTVVYLMYFCHAGHVSHQLVLLVGGFVMVQNDGGETYIPSSQLVAPLMDIFFVVSSALVSGKRQAVATQRSIHSWKWNPRNSSWSIFYIKIVCFLWVLPQLYWVHEDNFCETIVLHEYNASRKFINALCACPLWTYVLLPKSRPFSKMPMAS